MSLNPPAPSKRSNISPFIVMDVMRAAAEREASGAAVIHMEVGEPGSAPPLAAREAVMRLLSGGPVGYTGAFGLPALRARISQHYQDLYGASVDPERIVVTMGSSAAFILSFLAAFDAGDRIGVQIPGYPAYRNTTAALDLVPVSLRTSAATRWTPTPTQVREAHMQAPLKGLLIASPNNPTGTVISRSDLSKLAQTARDLGLWLISDEIYHGLTYGVGETTALAVEPDAIVINSFSKYWCMTGWRVGWMVVPERLLRPVEKLAQNLFISPPLPSQVAALAAFDAGPELELIKAGYAENRAALMAALPDMGFDEVLPMDGAFYAYASVKRFSNDSRAFAAQLLAETGIAATPGHDFDPEDGHRYLRFSYAGKRESIEACIAGLRAFTARLR
jgi:aspartate/methionine/tyrosine aminotransferase